MSTLNSRTCEICKEDKNISEFYKSRYICKKCWYQQTKSYFIRNREKIQKQKTEWYSRNNFKYAYRKAKATAKRRGYSFNLSEEQFNLIVSSNCIYCGRSNAKGIDRKDNSIGYEFLNCAPCCNDCNYAKKSMSINEFKNMIIRIYNNLILNELAIEYSGGE